MLNIRLFGRFCTQCNGQVLEGLNASRLQELFCYLLLYRNRLHPREILASLLWSNVPTAQSKKYLRQALWQLQVALNGQGESSTGHVMLVDSEWVCINPAADMWLDVAVFQQAFAHVQNVPGRALDALRIQALSDAADLYRGDLLEGWFQDWCLYEREQFQNMYLAILDKLMDHCEAHGEYETGLTYGKRILSYDQAREDAHRGLMRLYCLAGDRTAALRQYDCCLETLRRELAVRPSAKTVALYEQIREDQFTGSVEPFPTDVAASAADPLTWRQMLDRLKHIQTMLTQVQGHVQHDIEAVELALGGQ
jgi:DNA-binding SARP family transcriptional activator